MSKDIALKCGKTYIALLFLDVICGMITGPILQLEIAKYFALVAMGGLLSMPVFAIVAIWFNGF